MQKEGVEGPVNLLYRNSATLLGWLGLLGHSVANNGREPLKLDMNCWPMPAQKECQLSWSSRQPSEVRIDESLYFLGRRRLPSLASSIEAEGYNLRYKWKVLSGV